MDFLFFVCLQFPIEKNFISLHYGVSLNALSVVQMVCHAITSSILSFASLASLISDASTFSSSRKKYRYLSSLLHFYSLSFHAHRPIVGITNIELSFGQQILCNDNVIPYISIVV